jgi:hypothetical protein
MLAADEAVAAAQTALHDTQTRTGAEVRKITGGLWSWLIFSSQAGWDAFHDCLSTQLAAYNLDSHGTGAPAPWAAKAAADFAFTADGYVDSSLRVGQVANARSIVNSVDIKFEYRFTRLFEYTFPLQWAASNTTVVSAVFGSQNWGLNDHKRVADALTGAGLCVRAQAGLYGKSRPLAGAPLPGLSFAPVPEAGMYALAFGQEVFYGSDVPRYSAIAGFSCQALKRYRQTVAETAIHSVTYPQSIAQTGRMNRAVSHAAESKLQPTALLQETVDGWDETASDAVLYPVSKGMPAFGLGPASPPVALALNRYVFVQPKQKPDNTVKASIGGCQNWDITQSPIDGRQERDNAFAVARAVAIKTIAASHRQAEVSFDIPAHETLELSHTVEVSREAPAFQAKGKVKALAHVYDIVVGSALTTVTIALMKSWSTGAHYVDPYIPLPDVGTITYPGTLFRSQLTSWPETDHALMGSGSADELATEPPASKRFRGYNFFTSQFILEAPPVPQEAQANFVTVTRTSETVTLPDDTFVVAA